MKLADHPELAQLSASEKLLLVEELWDAIAEQGDSIEPPAWHDKLLDEDAADYAANPTRGGSWTEVKRRITGQA